MLQKFKEMSYGSARYLVLRELDERGPIGQLLLRYDSQLAVKMMNFCDWIDRSAIACGENRPDDIDWRKANDIPGTLMMCAETFPFLILTASELDWTGFLSAWITIAKEFLAIAGYIAANSPEDQRHGINNIMRGVEETLRPTYTLMELGVSYIDLIKASSNLVQEMQKWRQSQPAAIRLSEAYLKALGVMKPDEGPATHGPMKDGPRDGCVPPPPPHDDGNNPPPPPPPPHN